MKKLKLLLDVDEVICFSGYLELANEFLGKHYVIDDFTDYYIDKALIPESRISEFNDFASSKNQYESPTFLPGAVDAVIRLSKYFEIYFCSDCRYSLDIKRSGRIFLNKFDLLYKTFPQDIIPAKNYIFTGTKNIFKADVQVDDLLSNLDPDIPFKILFPSYHNKTITDDELTKKGVIRAGYDWKLGWENTEKILMDILKTVKN